MVQKNPKRDIRLRKNTFAIKLGFDVDYKRMIEILKPIGLPKLYRIKDLVFTEDLIVNQHLRPNHSINKKGSVNRLLIKRIHTNNLDIEISQDDKIIIHLSFSVYHWTRLLQFDIIGFQEKLLLFFENKINPSEVLYLENLQA